MVYLSELTKGISMTVLKQVWRNQTTSKLIILGVLTIILMLPISMIESLLWERHGRQDFVVDQMAEQWGGPALIQAVFIRIPYRQVSNGQVYIRDLFIFPELVKIEGALGPQVRRRGIYKVPVFEADLVFSGTFDRPDIEAQGISTKHILWQQAELVLGLSELVGLSQVSPVMVDKLSYELQAGLKPSNVAKQGLYTTIEMVNDWQTMSFSGAFKMNASQAIRFVPLGQKTKVKLTSSWSDPSFVGNFLPNSRQVDEQGFTASWQILGLNRNIPKLMLWNDSYDDESSSFGVNLLIRSDVYQQVERIIKYAIMFLVFTFSALFCAEILSRKGIHPVQYLMIGLAVAVFYVLLLSLAEHIGFAWAYALSAALITILVGLYCRVLGDGNRLSWYIAGLLILLYSYLYLLLQMQDFALLAGSVAILGLLATVMFITRHIDWYGES